MMLVVQRRSLQSCHWTNHGYARRELDSSDLQGGEQTRSSRHFDGELMVLSDTIMWAPLSLILLQRSVRTAQQN